MTPLPPRTALFIEWFLDGGLLIIGLGLLIWGGWESGFLGLLLVMLSLGVLAFRKHLEDQTYKPPRRPRP